MDLGLCAVLGGDMQRRGNGRSRKRQRKPAPKVRKTASILNLQKKFDRRTRELDEALEQEAITRSTDCSQVLTDRSARPQNLVETAMLSD